MKAVIAADSRLAFVDAVKAVASQLIVLHHLAFYGPMSDHVESLGPALVGWFSEYARMAVQVFLVVGGFLAAQTFARYGDAFSRPPVELLKRRYLKLAAPYIGALLLALLAAAVARRLIEHSSIPDSPTLAQFAAHLFLLHGVLGFDGLSAGAWYVAIDFQLYALLLGLLWLTQRFGHRHVPSLRLGLVVGLIAVSLLYFNRNPEWDNWAIYFFGAYGLGALTYWTVGEGAARKGWLAVALAIVLLALAIDFRPRIAVALATALVLGLVRYSGCFPGCARSACLAWLGRISYSVFLVHFPIILIVNAVFERHFPHSPWVQLAGIVLAWSSSVAGGALFNRYVEHRSVELLHGFAARLVRFVSALRIGLSAR